MITTNPNSEPQLPANTAEIEQLLNITQALFRMPVAVQIHSSGNDIFYASTNTTSRRFLTPHNQSALTAFPFVYTQPVKDLRANTIGTIYLADSKMHRLSQQQKQLLSQVSAAFSRPVLNFISKNAGIILHANDVSLATENQLPWFNRK